LERSICVSDKPYKFIRSGSEAEVGGFPDVFGVRGRGREPTGKIVGRIKMRPGLRFELSAPVFHAEN